MLFAFVILAYFTPSTLGRHCIETALSVSQDCSNNRKIYFSIEGRSVGFGSEFNYYLTHTILDAIFENRRLVNIRTGDMWPYDCPQRIGWSCFFQYQCTDSVIPHLFQLEFDKRNVFHKQNLSVHDIPSIQNLLGDSFSKFYLQKESCDTSVLNITAITSIIAKYAFNLNENTLKFVNEFNAFYKLDNIKYISILLSISERHPDVDDKTWNTITDTNAQAQVVTSYILANNSEIQDMYISTDHCEMVAELQKNIQSNMPTPMRFHTPCVQGSMEFWLYGNPTRNNYGHANRLVSEIMMLVNSDIFVGVPHSQLTHLVNRLRYNTSKTVFVSLS